MVEEKRLFLCEGIFWDATKGGRQSVPQSGAYRGLLRLRDDLLTSCEFTFPEPVIFNEMQFFFMAPLFYPYVKDSIVVGQAYDITEVFKTVGRLKVLE